MSAVGPEHLAQAREIAPVVCVQPPSASPRMSRRHSRPSSRPARWPAPGRLV